MKENNNDYTKRLQSIIETAIDGIVCIDSKGIVETINPAAATLFGYMPNEVISKNISMLMPSPHREAHDQYIKKYQITKRPKVVGIGREVQGIKKDGTLFPIRLAISEVKLNDRVIYTGIIHDLTDVNNAQNEIIKLNQQLEQKVTERTYDLEKVVNRLLETKASLETEISERNIIESKLKKQEDELRSTLEKEKELNEMKTRFVSMASHEFRTPLASILSSASLIGRYPLGDQQDKRVKHITKIKSAVDNLTSILNDFLTMSKLEEGKVGFMYTDQNLYNLCEEVIEDAQNFIKSDRRITITEFGKRIETPIAESIVRNILFNLINNALKYSDEEIECHIQYNQDSYQIKVIDTGIGIPIDDQKHLFTRFFRARNVVNTQGTGLGLNIVKKYVELLEGTITFESIYHEGSTFKIIIPYKNGHN